MPENKIDKELLDQLKTPFPKIKWRPQNIITSKKDNRNWGIMVPYIDSRQVVSRLNNLVGVGGWTFTWEQIPVGVEKYIKQARVWDGKVKSPEKDIVDQRYVVKGILTILGNVKEDVGYPNSDNDINPIKSAVSDAIKRCAVQFGMGAFLYSIEAKYIEYDQYKKKPKDPNDLKKLENMFQPIGGVGNKK